MLHGHAGARRAARGRRGAGAKAWREGAAAAAAAGGCGRRCSALNGIPRSPKELRNIFQRVIRLAGEGIAPRDWRTLVALAQYRSTSPSSSRGAMSSIRFSPALRQEAGRRGAFLLAAAETPPEFGPGEYQPLARARHAHVTQPPLFFQRLLGIDRPAVREQAVLPGRKGTPRETPGPWRCAASSGSPAIARPRRRRPTPAPRGRENRMPFAALGGFGGRIDQFIQVLQARLGFRRLFLLQHPAVAGALQNELIKSGSDERAPPATVPESGCGKSPAPIASAWGNSRCAVRHAALDGVPQAQPLLAARAFRAVPRWCGRCRAPAY